MDQQVLKAQHWVNTTYAAVPGYVACAETGITGWSTMYSLTRALQHELGITALSDSFGAGTQAALTAHGPVTATDRLANLRTLVQAGLWCKGYAGGFTYGSWDTTTAGGIASWKADLGLPSGGPASVDTKQLKALLTMDAYVLLPGGTADVRAVQQWLNATFLPRRDFFVVPCDGLFSRTVQVGLVYALQYSLGLTDGVANGVVGPTTRSLLGTRARLVKGSSDSGASHLVRLFKAALVANRQTGVDWASTTFTVATVTATKAFQRFCVLPVTGVGDVATWLSLLLSSGDPDRATTACDCVTPLDAPRARALTAAGYTAVLRYLTGGPQKALTPAEVTTILGRGLALVPIYQESNNDPSLFTPATGRVQAQSAYAAATALRLPAGTTIYFAVDFDATSDEVRAAVLPYFAAVASTTTSLGGRYRVGVYGSRNVCSLVSAAGHATLSFVSGMSTGFSGNLGFPLPANWAFDQIQTVTVAAGKPGRIEVDKDVSSGRDPGVRTLAPKTAGAR